MPRWCKIWSLIFLKTHIVIWHVWNCKPQIVFKIHNSSIYIYYIFYVQCNGQTWQKDISMPPRGSSPGKILEKPLSWLRTRAPGRQGTGPLDLDVKIHEVMPPMVPANFMKFHHLPWGYDGDITSETFGAYPLVISWPSHGDGAYPSFNG